MEFAQLLAVLAVYHRHDVVESYRVALIAYLSNTHQWPRDGRDLKDRLNVPTIVREVQLGLAQVGDRASVAD